MISIFETFRVDENSKQNLAISNDLARLEPNFEKFDKF